jgi:cytochrome c2
MGPRALFLAFSGVLAVCVLGCVGPGTKAEDREQARRGRDVYAFEGCASCHGGERQGTKSAPPLTALRRHWSADELGRYLRGPRAYPKDTRLRRVGERFPAEMAGVPAASPERLRDLVAFLLSP